MKRPGNEREYRLIANAIRQDIIKVLAKNGGYTAGNLSAVEILTALYFGVLKHDPRRPDWKERDRVFVTETLAPAWNATLAHAGYFAKRELLTKPPESQGTPFGQGLSVSAGSALAAKLDAKQHHVHCILGDGEQNQGQIWEALMFAGKNRLNNLTLIINRNNTQETGYTENVMPLEPLRAKYEAFNWHVIETDGHNICHLMDALNEAKAVSRPTVILAHTIAGKGISFMENRSDWSARPPTSEQEKKSIAELQHERT